MKICFSSWNPRKGFFSNAVSPLVEHHRAKGDEIFFRDYHGWRTSKLSEIEGLDRVYMWNAEYHFLKGAIRYCEKEGIPINPCEVAWFPQSEKIYVDSRGTNGNSDLFFDDLSWLTDADYKKMYALREQYRDGIEEKDKGYVFVPLQLSQDTAIQKWSPLKTMGDVVRMALKTFPDRKIIFRKHPKDPKNFEDLGITDSLKEGNSGDMKTLIMESSLVWGANSTVLTEAALMGKPVINFGKSLLNIGQSRDQALAALVAREIPMDTRDLTPWMSRGRSLEHLA